MQPHPAQGPLSVSTRVDDNLDFYRNGDPGH
jgi:hypothetical protein